MTAFLLTKEELAIVKKIAKLTGIAYQTIAARPTLAKSWIEEFKRTGKVSPK